MPIKNPPRLDHPEDVNTPPRGYAGDASYNYDHPKGFGGMLIFTICMYGLKAVKIGARRAFSTWAKKKNMGSIPVPLAAWAWYKEIQTNDVDGALPILQAQFQRSVAGTSDADFRAFHLDGVTSVQVDPSMAEWVLPGDFVLTTSASCAKAGVPLS